MKVKSKKNNKATEYRVLIWLTIIIFLVCLTYGLLLYNNENRGTFGDMFGALSALFSGLAFAGIIYTIQLQRIELKLQRKELRQTREEFKIQNETLKYQRFENTFFNLLTHHNKIIESLYYLESSQRVEKHDVFRHAYNILKGKTIYVNIQLRKEYGLKQSQSLDDLNQIQVENLIIEATKKAFDDASHNLHLYFQSLSQILKFVDKSDILKEDSKRLYYVSLIKDQITDFENVLVQYYCLLPIAQIHTLNFLINKYELINTLPDYLLLTARDKGIFQKWAIKNEP